MENNDLLDDKDDGNLLFGMVQWWEQRRLRYNLIVGSVGLVVWLLVFTLVNSSLGYDRIGNTLVIYAFIYTLGANTGYLLGWIFEMLLYYYFDIFISKPNRTVLYWAGVLISILPLVGFLIAIVMSFQ